MWKLESVRVFRQFGFLRITDSKGRLKSRPDLGMKHIWFNPVLGCEILYDETISHYGLPEVDMLCRVTINIRLVAFYVRLYIEKHAPLSKHGE